MELVFSFFLLIAIVSSHQPYDPEQGKLHYFYAGVVNCDDDLILNWSCTYPCKHITGMQDIQVVYDQANNIKVYSGYQANTNQIIISFRHTEDWRNWMVNSKFLQKKFELCTNCYVHTGFVDAFHGIKPQLLIDIKNIQAKHSGTNIVLVGHSLGGALATIAATEFQALDLNVKSLYTYGGPRVGNDEFSQYVNSKINIFRHVHYSDIVPHIPPMIGYKHSVEEIWQSKPGNTYVICSDVNGEDPNCSNSLGPTKYTTEDHNLYFGLLIGCQR